MSNDFTRGPWYRSGCTVYAPNDRNNANRFTAYVQDAHSSREDLLSVARMMQAAPDLFDALEYALPYLEACVPSPRNGVNADGSVDVNCVDRARAAIAKATGKEHAA